MTSASRALLAVALHCTASHCIASCKLLLALCALSSRFWTRCRRASETTLNYPPIPDLVLPKLSQLVLPSHPLPLDVKAEPALQRDLMAILHPKSNLILFFFTRMMQRKREGSTWGETFGFRSNRGGSVAKQGPPSPSAHSSATLYSSYDITFGDGPLGIEFMSNISERKWVLLVRRPCRACGDSMYTALNSLTRPLFHTHTTRRNVKGGSTGGSGASSLETSSSFSTDKRPDAASKIYTQQVVGFRATTLAPLFVASANCTTGASVCVCVCACSLSLSLSPSLSLLPSLPLFAYLFIITHNMNTKEAVAQQKSPDWSSQGIMSLQSTVNPRSSSALRIQSSSWRQQGGQ